ncbi:GntR family transcriptional regulator [Nocardia carnea]|uniref:GntR family transcriptional regulator n=1 Tax=Nocardia carnea TaxID=37328 RepID=UPI0024583DB6|nr:GntR family transcriptional regulator [Nocardia carnea]
MAAKQLRAANRVRVKDDVLAVLRAAILEGSFAPGEHLNEASLADQLEVSRGPIRDALSSLAHEGLVVIEPHKGATVPLMSKNDVDEIYTLRLALEMLAAKSAVVHATPEDLSALGAATADLAAVVDAGGSIRDITDADLRFHDAFYRAAHHQRLYASWRSVRSQVALCLFSRNTVSATSREIVVGEHVQILQLLMDRDQESLVKAVDEHLRGAYERLVRHYD